MGAKGVGVMSYTPKVGDRVRFRSWDDGEFIDVEWVGRRCFSGRSELGVEFVLPLPIPDEWRDEVES